MISDKFKKEAARKSLENMCIDCKVSFTPKDTNADLCMKINDNKEKKRKEDEEKEKNKGNSNIVHSILFLLVIGGLITLLGYEPAKEYVYYFINY